MREIRCAFCNRIITKESELLFRLPSDYMREVDSVYLRYINERGIKADHIMPGTVNPYNASVSELLWEKNSPVLILKTGRQVDELICPSCHNKIQVDTFIECVKTSVVFGVKNSGKTSLILAIMNEAANLGIDGNYCFIFNKLIYPSEIYDDISNKLLTGYKPPDLRNPVIMHRPASASSGGLHMTDVFHDVSSSDCFGDLSINEHLPFATDAQNFIYCLSARYVGENACNGNIMSNMERELDIYAMYYASKHSSLRPVLNIVITKLDECRDIEETGIGEYFSGIYEARNDEDSLKKIVFSVFPCFEELKFLFSDVRVFAVSAIRVSVENEDENSVMRLYRALY